MPIEVENIVEPVPAAVEEAEAPASVPLEGAVERPTLEPVPKKRGRPPGSKNKPRVPEEPAPVRTSEGQAEAEEGKGGPASSAERE